MPTSFFGLMDHDDLGRNAIHAPRLLEVALESVFVHNLRIKKGHGYGEGMEPLCMDFVVSNWLIMFGSARAPICD